MIYYILIAPNGCLGMVFGAMVAGLASVIVAAMARFGFKTVRYAAIMPVIMGATVVDGTLQLSDLRMGNEPDYFFRFTVAQRTGDGWTSIPPTQAPMARDIAETWNATWGRIWHEPAPTGLDSGEAIGSH